MLFGAFFAWLGSILMWLAGFVRLPEPPAFLLGAGAGDLHRIMEQAAGLCNFVDFSMWPQAVWFCLNVYLAGFTIRVIRVVAGFFVG